ncbi:MAG TPA: hypothetical protein VFE57_07575 [Cyclobacteriaceae bacterium]|jgi:hypothetical protein|nr:hypothetical protein [Cyclobacteriaceae bacterium]
MLQKGLMDQLEFSNAIKIYLETRFPLYIPSSKFHDDDSFEFTIKSNSGKINIWIATFDLEITIGLEDTNGNSDTHWHLGRAEEHDISELFSIISEFVSDIITDKKIIVQKEQKNHVLYSLTDDLSKIKLKDSIINSYKWSKI